MNQQEEYRQVLSELIRKQMTILGSDITLAKVSNVHEIQVDESGNVVAVTGDPQAVLQKLINEFVELSGLIVKKTMESIVNSNSRVEHTSVSQQELEDNSLQVSQEKKPAQGTNSSPYSAEVVNTVHEALSDLDKN